LISKAHSFSYLICLHVLKYFVNFFFIHFFWSFLQLILNPKAVNERHYSKENHPNQSFKPFCLILNILLRIFELHIFLSLFQLFIILIFLVDLIIQNLRVTFAVFHFPIQIIIAIYLSKASPYSFFFWHVFKLSRFM